MELHISDKDLRRTLADDGKLKRQYGKDMASKLRIRLAVLRGAQSLAVFWPPFSGPERCHELKGRLAGVFSIDLKQPYRLLFKPLEDSPPVDRTDELKRWKEITAVEITAIEDTHG
jgi:proteic killer suppression protein